MPIKLILTQTNNLEINASEQSNFSIEDQGVSIALPFKTVDRGKDYIVIDPSDYLNNTVEYILTELKKSNYSVKLDSNLQDYWENYIYEGGKINEIRKNKRIDAIEEDVLQGFFRGNRKLFKHQIQGIQHAIKVENAANFSVPGSGKTQTALGIFRYWKKTNLVDKALVVGPASCFEPWEDEIKVSLRIPFSTLRWSGSISKRQRIGIKVKDVDIILVTYQTACNDHLFMEQLMKKYKLLLILDESHYIKNPSGVRSQASIRLAPYAKRRLILTGTPAPHSLSDIWTQFSFLWPSQQLFGRFYDFQQNIENSSDAVNKISRDLKPFFHRTTKKQLGLPDITQENYLIPDNNIPLEQKRIIEALELKTLTEARRLSISDLDMNVLRDWRKARIIRLLQAVSNPALLLSRIDLYNINKEFDIDTSDLIGFVSIFLEKRKIPAKIETVLKKTIALVKSGRKVVIWSWFVENIKYLNELLDEYNPLMIYGEIKPYEEKEDSVIEESRERNLHEFKNRKDRPILLANPAACAEAISLHKQCQNAIYLDRNFNCGQFIQSMDRIHRVGMPPGSTATYYIPLINCAIERAVDKRLKIRQRVLYRILNDPMPILGIDEGLWVSDSENELDKDFDEIIKEIEHGETKKSH